MSTTIRNPGGVGRPPDDGPPQPELFDASTFEADRPPTMAERFEAFHAANPAIYADLVRYSREWIRLTGRRKLGIARLWERLRWDLEVQTTEECPKLNNDYKAFYSRLLMQEPDLDGLFEVRRSAADDVFGRGSEAA